MPTFHRVFCCTYQRSSETLPSLFTCTLRTQGITQVLRQRRFDDRHATSGPFAFRSDRPQQKESTSMASSWTAPRGRNRRGSWWSPNRRNSLCRCPYYSSAPTPRVIRCIQGPLFRTIFCFGYEEKCPRTTGRGWTLLVGTTEKTETIYPHRWVSSWPKTLRREPGKRMRTRKQQISPWSILRLATATTTFCRP